MVKNIWAPCGFLLSKSIFASVTLTNISLKFVLYYSKATITKIRVKRMENDGKSCENNDRICISTDPLSTVVDLCLI